MTVSYEFFYHNTPLWEEYQNDDEIIDFSPWLRRHRPDLNIRQRHFITDLCSVSITFKEEKDLTYFLLTL